MIRDMVVFGGNKIRLANRDDGEPGACVADICASLGIKNPSTSTTRVAAKDIFSKDTLTAGGKQSMLYVTEIGVYVLLAGSRKPLAKELTESIAGYLAAYRKNANSTKQVAGVDWDAIRLLAQGMSEIKSDVDSVKSEIADVKADIAILKVASEVKLLANPVPLITRRQETVALVDRHMKEHPGDFADYNYAWLYLWDLCRLRLHRDIAGEARKLGWKSIIAYAEYVGEMERVWQIAKEAFINANRETTATPGN